MNLTLNVYSEDKKSIAKTVKATEYDLMFGTVNKLMGILKIEETKDTTELLKVVYSAWNEITSILTEVFPEMEASDWDYVKVKELMPVIVTIAKYSITEALSIPTEPKNVTAPKKIQ